jgi:hypothetical protein
MWRLLTRLDDARLSVVLAGWLRTRTPPVTARPRRYRTAIAVDGKTMQGVRLADGRQTHLLSALDTGTGIVLAPVTVDTKSNESPPSRRCSTLSRPCWAALPECCSSRTHCTPRPAMPSRPPAARYTCCYRPGQPAHPSCPAQSRSLGTDPGRRPHPRHRSRPQGDPHRQGRHPAHAERDRGGAGNGAPPGTGRSSIQESTPNGGLART